MEWGGDTQGVYTTDATSHLEVSILVAHLGKITLT
jgi:hypothetical protein